MSARTFSKRGVSILLHLRTLECEGSDASKIRKVAGMMDSAIIMGIHRLWVTNWISCIGGGR